MTNPQNKVQVLLKKAKGESLCRNQKACTVIFTSTANLETLTVTLKKYAQWYIFDEEVVLPSVGEEHGHRFWFGLASSGRDASRWADFHPEDKLWKCRSKPQTVRDHCISQGFSHQFDRSQGQISSELHSAELEEQKVRYDNKIKHLKKIVIAQSRLLKRLSVEKSQQLKLIQILQNQLQENLSLEEQAKQEGYMKPTHSSLAKQVHAKDGKDLPSQNPNTFPILLNRPILPPFGPALSRDIQEPRKKRTKIPNSKYQKDFVQ
jgi:hypothetical protein